MKNSQPVDTNHDYTVGVEPLYTKDGMKTSLCGTRRADNGHVIASVKCGYGLIQNVKLTDMAEDAFRVNGLGEFKRSVSVCRGGARMFARYDFRDELSKIPNAVPKVGDKVGLRLTVQNSFDGSSPVNLQFGALRLICTNGMTTMDSEFSLTKKHTTGISLESFKIGLDECLGKYSDILQVFGEMSTIDLPQPKGIALITGLGRKGIVSERNAEKVLEIWNRPTYKEDAPRTLWSAYNATTQWLSSDFEAKHFENAQKLNARIGSEFVEMASNHNRIAELIAVGEAVEA